VYIGYTTVYSYSSNFLSVNTGSVVTEINFLHKGKAVSTVTGLEWPRGFQEVKVPRFHDNGKEWW
jgi:hypothetical protein